MALICAVGSYALMSFVMTGAPLAMVGCGFSPDEATLGISWHVMAMFGPSFFTGRLIPRFGVERIVAFGLLLLIGCAVVALSGMQLWQFWTSLILLGLGWNFGFIGATAMVAETYRRQEKGKVRASTISCCSAGRVRLADVRRGLQRLGLGHAQLGGVPGDGICLAALTVLLVHSRGGRWRRAELTPRRSAFPQSNQFAFGSRRQRGRKTPTTC